MNAVFERLRVGAAAVLLTASSSAAQDEANLSELRVGHRVEVRGTWEGSERFLADDVRLVEPDDEQGLIGTVSRGSGAAGWFELLGQRVRVDGDTEWDELDVRDVGALVGRRLEVEGDYHDPGKFSAEKLQARSPGRERIAGRVDAIRRTPAGLELDVMRFLVVVPAGAEYEAEVPTEGYPLLDATAPSRLDLLELGFGPEGRRAQQLEGFQLEGRDDDDDIRASLWLTDDLALGLRSEFRRRDERDLNLDRGNEEDRLDHTFNVRAELIYRPRSDFLGLVDVSQEARWRDDEEDGYEDRASFRVNEVYGHWRELYGSGFSLQLGRQDFDEPREWLWDENLDAVRLHWRGEGVRVELAAATVISDGDLEDENTDTLIAYVTNDDEDRVLGAYVVDRRFEADGFESDKPFLYGVRAFGEWIEDHEVWFELAGLDGYRGTTDLAGWGADVGTTWYPDALDPFYFTAGYALGSGDADPGDGRDGNFRQTGLNDNNAKFGGVTSFRYYGEVFDPDLSNLAILTLGVGCRIADDHSVDLVYHRYHQETAAASLGESDLDATPNGLDRYLGEELDLILGSRVNEQLHLELVLGAFDPGPAFDDDEMAWMAQFQVRFNL